MDQQIEQEVVTKKATKSAVFTTTLMLAALFALGGFGFAYLLSQQDTIEKITPVITEPDSTSPDPAEAADVFGMSVSSNPEGPSMSGGIVIKGTDIAGNPDHEFGRYDYGTYTDGDVTTSPIPLVVQIESDSHPAMLITLKTSDVVVPTCGDGVCDIALNEQINCPQDCTGVPHCGDGIIDPSEECDGIDLNGHTCVSQGYDGGTLNCSATCQFDTSSCTTGDTSYNSLFNIPEAHAQVIITDYLTVCIPEKTAISQHCSNGIFEPALGETGLDCGGSCPACSTPEFVINEFQTSNGSGDPRLDVHLCTNIETVYNRTVDGATVAAAAATGSLQVVDLDNGSSPVSGTWTTVSSSTTFTPDDNFTSLTNFQVRLPKDDIKSLGLPTIGLSGCSSLGVPGCDDAGDTITWSFTTGVDCATTSYNSLFGIPEAHAQVNTNQGSEDPIVTNYYVDTHGNVYTDPSLTLKVNTTDCLSQIAKNYSPDELLDVTSNGTIDLGLESYLVFAKSWDAPLGVFNSANGFTAIFNDENEHKAPLFVTGSNSGETRTIPQQTLTVRSDLGTKNLCFPTKVLEEEWFVLFYDINGKPYSDMLLESPIACGTTNTCDSVNCKRQPYHVCCLQDDILK